MIFFLELFYSIIEETFFLKKNLLQQGNVYESDIIGVSEGEKENQNENWIKVE